MPQNYGYGLTESSIRLSTLYADAMRRANFNSDVNLVNGDTSIHQYKMLAAINSCINKLLLTSRWAFLYRTAEFITYNTGTPADKLLGDPIVLNAAYNGIIPNPAQVVSGGYTDFRSSRLLQTGVIRKTDLIPLGFLDVSEFQELRPTVNTYGSSAPCFYTMVNDTLYTYPRSAGETIYVRYYGMCPVYGMPTSNDDNALPISGSPVLKFRAHFEADIILIKPEFFELLSTGCAYYYVAHMSNDDRTVFLKNTWEDLLSTYAAQYKDAPGTTFNPFSYDFKIKKGDNVQSQYYPFGTRFLH